MEQLKTASYMREVHTVTETCQFSQSIVSSAKCIKIMDAFKGKFILILIYNLNMQCTDLK